MHKELIGIGVGAVLSAMLAGGCSPTVMTDRGAVPPVVDNPPPPYTAVYTPPSGVGVTDNARTAPSLPEPPQVQQQEHRRYQPINLGSIASGPTSATTSSIPATAAPAGTYKVAAGDTLSQIAQRHGVKTAALASYNHLDLKAIIRPGQVLQLPPGAKADSGKPAPAKANAKPAKPADTGVKAAPGATYTVVSGDTLGHIAQRHGVKTADLMKANNLTPKSVLQIGQKLVIPGGKAAVTPAPAGQKPQPSANATQDPSKANPANGSGANSTEPPPEIDPNMIPVIPDETPVTTTPVTEAPQAGAATVTPGAETVITTTIEEAKNPLIVDRDQSIADFAARYNVSEEVIRKFNASQVPADNILREGTVILVP